jgi:hypothetical protein
MSQKLIKMSADYIARKVFFMRFSKGSPQELCETPNHKKIMKKHNQIALAIVTLLALPMAVQATPVGAVPEPSTYYAGAACLIPLAVATIRAMRKSGK